MLLYLRRDKLPVLIALQSDWIALEPFSDGNFLNWSQFGQQDPVATIPNNIMLRVLDLNTLNTQSLTSLLINAHGHN